MVGLPGEQIGLQNGFFGGKGCKKQWLLANAAVAVLLPGLLGFHRCNIFNFQTYQIYLSIKLIRN
jgi:hypothetical protein